MGVGMLLLLIGIVFWGVIVRYLPLPVLMNLWIQEGGRMVLIWLSFLVAGFIVREGAHFQMTIVVEHMSPRAKLISDVISNIVVAMFAILLVVEASIYGRHTMSLWTICLRWPAVVLVIPFFLGSILIFAFATARLVSRVRQRFGQ